MVGLLTKFECDETQTFFRDFVKIWNFEIFFANSLSTENAAYMWNIKHFFQWSYTIWLGLIWEPIKIRREAIYVSFIYCFSSKGYALRGFFCLSFKWKSSPTQKPHAKSVIFWSLKNQTFFWRNSEINHNQIFGNKFSVEPIYIFLKAGSCSK